ncbi:MAG: hypothetical protein IJE59_00400 [Clostridia bacterium]|nr:hypothetical protein [Clostridia bacterium]
MIKKIAWETFKNTGDVNTFLELKQLQNIQAQMHEPNGVMQNIQQQMEAQNGNNQNEWYNNF